MQLCGARAYMKPLHTGADLSDQPMRPAQHRCEDILTDTAKKDPPFAAGARLGRRLQTKLIRGGGLYRNSHTLFEKQT